MTKIEENISLTHKIPEVTTEDIELVPDIVKGSVSVLFSHDYYKRTIMLWVLWFMGMFGYYGLFAWMPTLLVKAGHSMVKSFQYVFIMQLAYLPNQILSAYLMDKYGRKGLLVFNLFLSAVSAIFFGWALGHSLSMTQVILLGLVTSFFVSGVWGITYTYTPECYPTSVRVTGTSWASTCSRFGSMLAPIIVGTFLNTLGVTGVYGVIAGAFVIAGVFVAMFGIETKGEHL